MLLQFRRMTRGGVATAIIVLIGLATVAFLVPNGGLQMPLSSDIAEVAGRKITPAQLTRELDLTIRGQRSEGVNITREDAINAGFHLRLLEGMISRNAMYAYAERLGVGVSDTLVARRIRQIPAVVNPVTGSFSESSYDQFLRQLGYSRAEFEGDIRGDMGVQVLLGALVSGVRAPSSYGALAFAYENESRVVTIAEASVSAVGTIAPPTPEQLQSFYEESQQALRLPEFRELTLVYARLQDFASRADVPEARIREEFDARRAALTRPERRTYVRISAQTEAQADDAAARLNRGEAPDAIAAALGLQSTRGENQSRTEVPDAAIAEAVFAAPVRSVRVTRGRLTPWAVIRVDSVTPAVEPNYAELREEIRESIALESAGELLNDAIGAFQDERAAGTDIAEAARRHGLTVVNVPAVEAQGRGRDGQPVAAIAEHGELLAVGFETPEGEASDFVPAGDADVIVSVTRIIPASVRPFEEVRDNLARVWVARERSRRLREIGERVVAAVEGGQTLAEAARANSMRIAVASRPFTRRDAAEGIPAQGLAAQIFASNEGAVVSDVRADGAAVLVAVVERINRVDPAADPLTVEANRAALEESITVSFGESLQAEITARARPRRNDDLIARLYPSRRDREEEGR